MKQKAPNLFMLLLVVCIWSCDSNTPPPAKPTPTLPVTSPEDAAASDVAEAKGGPTTEQKNLLLEAKTRVLSGDDAGLVDALVKLFYSEPQNATQWAGGLELAEVLVRLGELERARKVAEALESQPQDGLYFVGSRLKLARLHAELLEQPEEAIAFYLEVLKVEPDYLFVYEQLFLLSGDETYQQSYVSKRDALVKELGGLKGGARRKELVEILSMVLGDDALIRATFTREVASESDEESLRAMEQWLEVKVEE